MTFAIAVMVSCRNQKEEQIEQEKDESSLSLEGRESHHSGPCPDFMIPRVLKYDFATHIARQ
jgi:hypothetical protein